MRVPSPVRYAAIVASLAAVFSFLSLGTKILQPENTVSLVYPATGLGAALLWGFGLRWWPTVVITQAILTYNASHSAWVTILVSSLELLVILLFCLTMSRLRVSHGLDRVRDLVVFIVGALFTTCVGGIGTFYGEYFFETTDVRQRLSDGLSFWLSDFVSILIFVPLVLSWRRWPFASRSRFLRWLTLTVPLVAIGALIAFSGKTAAATLFLLLPLVVFTAIAAGIAGASASGAVLLFIFIGMHLGQEPDPFNAIIRVVFVATATATGYILAVVWGERERNAKRLYELAHHDPLTGLVNRYELERRLQIAVEDGPPSAHALLYLDLDQFKLVNDTCGHLAGDRMLQELAVELQRVAPPGAKFARLGGDEFACIVLHATHDDVQALASVIHDAMSRYRFRVGSMSFAIGVSIGITFFPADGDTADAVLGRADIACYVAKEDGRHRSHVYLPRDEAMVQWHSSIQQVSQLEMAMENGSLQLWRQSIVDITGGPPTRFGEVLLRLVENGAVRTSADFLPFAQRFGLMDRIDRWVIENACRHLAECHDPSVRLSVNVSGSTLNDPSFYEHVIALPERYGVDPRRLCLEVTEGVAIHRLRQAVEAMNGLRERGFDIALDDFGAGVASFAYLQELPVTYVKIDGRIVQQLRTDPASELIIGSLVRLARLRDIECIAEWVESEEIIDRLRTLGVRYAQGYHLDVPAPLEEAPHARVAAAVK